MVEDSEAAAGKSTAPDGIGWSRWVRTSIAIPISKAASFMGRSKREKVRKIAEALDRAALRWGYSILAYPAGTTAERPGKRILIVSHRLDRTGAPKIAFEIAATALGKGHSVTVVAPGDGPLREQLHQIGADVVIAPAMQHWQKSYLAGAAEAFDLAICNTIVVWRVAEALAERVPTLMYIHEVSILEDILKAEVNARRLVSRLEIWCGSKLAADSLRLLQPAATVVPYGIESIANKPLDQWPSKLPGEKLQIGIFGSIEPRKGQDLAIAALETLPPKVSDLIHLRLYGEDTRSNYSSKLFQSLSNVVTYHGLLEPEEYHRAIVSCDAVLVSSRDDTLPLVSLDALSCGRVLMCTSTTGTSLYLEHGLSGYVAKDATADAISAMLSEAVADRHNWPAVGARGREVFDQNFSKDRFQQIVVQMIERKAAEAA